MKTSGQIFKINAYNTNKLKHAEKLKDKLMDVINGLTHLKYEKGTRDGDFSLREKLKDLKREIESLYKIIRTVSSGRLGDTEVFNEILEFYRERYLDNFFLGECLSSIRVEISFQEHRDRGHNISKASKKNERKLNLYAKNLERDLNEWEMIFSQKALPMLAIFINEINEIALFAHINDTLDSLIIGDNVFVLRGDTFEDFKKHIAAFLSCHIKNGKLYLSDKGMLDLVDRRLDDMGFRPIILNTKNITSAKLGDVITQIISEYNLKEQAGKFMKSGTVLETEASDPEKQDAVRVKDLMKIMEQLCYMEQAVRPDRGSQNGYAVRLAEKPDEQYLFFSPGTFDVSLKYVAEYLRDALIFILDWLSREIQKNPKSSEAYEPVVECIPNINTFIRTYNKALEVASIKSNQEESKLLAKERHYISGENARELIQIIMETGTNIHDALIAVSYKAGGDSLFRGGGSKKIKIIQNSFDNTLVKIKRGLAKI